MIDITTGICMPDEFPSNVPLIPLIVERYADIAKIQTLHSSKYSNIEIGRIYHLRRPLTLTNRVLITSIEFQLTKTLLHRVTDECYSCLAMIAETFKPSNPYSFPGGYIQSHNKQQCTIFLLHDIQFHLIAPSFLTLKDEVQEYFKLNAEATPLEQKNAKPQELLGVFDVSDIWNERIPDCTGCYAVHNISRDQWYVGQAHSITKRLKQHFGGVGGNGDVYADFKYGEVFEILIYPLHLSSFKTLSQQEHYYIEYFDAYNHGYNRMK